MSAHHGWAAKKNSISVPSKMHVFSHSHNKSFSNNHALDGKYNQSIVYSPQEKYNPLN